MYVASVHVLALTFIFYPLHVAAIRERRFSLRDEAFETQHLQESNSHVASQPTLTGGISPDQSDFTGYDTEADEEITFVVPTCKCCINLPNTSVASGLNRSTRLGMNPGGQSSEPDQTASAKCESPSVRDVRPEWANRHRRE